MVCDLERGVEFEQSESFSCKAAGLRGRDEFCKFPEVLGGSCEVEFIAGATWST